ALAPEELFLTAEELRQVIPMRQRIELRTLGRAAAELDLDLSLDAEAPKVELGRARGTRQPVFLFPAVESALEIELLAQSTLRYHGRIADLVAEVNRSLEEAKTTVFVMPSLGVAERIVEILTEYNIETRLAFTSETSETTVYRQVVVTVGR